MYVQFGKRINKKAKYQLYKHLLVWCCSVCGRRSGSWLVDQNTQTPVYLMADTNIHYSHHGAQQPRS